MLSLLGWLPVVGPIIDGITTVFGKFQDTKLGIYQVDSQTTIASWKAANDLTLGFKDSIPVRLARDMVMFPGALWCALYIWGRTWDIYEPSWVIPVKSLDGPMAYLPYALLTFFFGMAALRK